MTTQRMKQSCPLCKGYGRPGYIVNANQVIPCFQCNPTTTSHKMPPIGTTLPLRKKKEHSCQKSPAQS